MESPLLLAVPAVGGLALAVRLVTVLLLIRAQRAARERALAARGGPSAPAGGLAATVGELLVGSATGFGLLLLMTNNHDLDFYPLLWSTHYDSTINLAYLWGYYGYPQTVEEMVSGIASLLGWLALWLLTQRRLMATGMPQGFRPSPLQPYRLVGGVIMRLALGVLVLPIGLVVAALLFQVVAVVTAGRPRTALTPPPVPPQPHAPPIGQPWPYAAQAPHAQPAPSPQPHPAPQGAP
ncbi:hypothetical protein ACWGB8_36235, partial [Kitasatospora sp. NPDC054939]